MDSTRHGFNLRLKRRELDLQDDRTRDKGNRSYDNLHYEAEQYDCYEAVELAYTFYTQRYPNEIKDPVEEASLLMTEQDLSHDVELYSHSDSDDSSCNVSRRRRIGCNLVYDCRGNVDPKVLDIKLDILDERLSLFNSTCESIIKDMSDTETTEGKLVELIGDAKKRTEKDLQDAFVELFNCTTRRFILATNEDATRPILDLSTSSKKQIIND
jgi:hypothetical protein